MLAAKKGPPPVEEAIADGGPNEVAGTVGDSGRAGARPLAGDPNPDAMTVPPSDVLPEPSVAAASKVSEAPAVDESAPKPGKVGGKGRKRAGKAKGKGGDRPNLNHATYYLNRELSWLEFNRRVLDEALDPTLPLLERVRFLSIFASNLDEFFMVRVSGLWRQLEAGVVRRPADGMSPAEQLAAVRERLQPLREAAYRCWREDVMPRLREAGIQVVGWSGLKKKQQKLLRKLFEREIFPTLTPLAFDPGHPFPHISNLSINLAVVVRDGDLGERFARLKVPGTFPRLLRIPAEEQAGRDRPGGLATDDAPWFVWIEEVIAANLDLLFPGLEVVASYPFRVTRDADVEIEEDEAADLLKAMVEVVGQRQFGSAVRLEVDERTPARIRDILEKNLEIAPYQVFPTRSPIGRADLVQLTALDRPELKFPPAVPFVQSPLVGEAGPFAAISRRDFALYHPYDSFAPVVGFLEAAARDPDVLAIKQTLYRVGPNSPIVKALMEARENGKQVSVLVELKARFDEEHNIGWARALDSAGVHVVYGVVGLKTHAKACLVVRRERDGIRRYLHLATGNYNPATARAYTDVGFFTADPALAEDVSDLFNALTGYSRKDRYRKLLVAPGRMRELLVDRIEREAERHRQHGDGHLVFKMNALVDKACIKALYRASQAGVRIDLQVRGVCCLRPGIEGISETITVTSIVGRFLEHARMYWFRNGGDEELFAGSADLMPRNLDGRVELLFPVQNPALLAALRDGLLFVLLRDTAKARRLQPYGNWERVAPRDGEKPFNSQEWLLKSGGSWRLEE
jgi:polyphosphate kinase